MEVGEPNWPAPAPEVPAWQVLAVVQVSSAAAPVSTPQPKANRKLPDESNLSTRLLFWTGHVDGPAVLVDGDPCGVASWPAPAPLIPDRHGPGALQTSNAAAPVWTP